VTSSSPGNRPAARGTRCWTLHGVEGVVDVSVTAADDDELGAVLPALGRLLGTAGPQLWAGSTRLPPDLPLTAAQLAHGAVLGLGRPGPRAAARERASALELHVTGGPEAGRAVALESGSHLLGRGSGAQVRLDDPDVSRRHAVVAVGAEGITVADLGSTNGTRLGGRTVGPDPRPWPVGGVLRLGSTSIRVTGPGAVPAALGGSAAGRVVLHPAPRPPARPQEVEVAFPRRPEPPAPRRLPWPAVALPAVAGVVMALALHTPSFLFFAVLSPLVGVGSWASERWSGRRAQREGAAEHAAALATAQARSTAALEADRAAAERAAPDLAALLTAVRRRSSLVWSRGAGDDDALTVRLGTGRTPTSVVHVGADGTRERVPGEDRPVVVDLRATKGLGVVGPRPAGLAVLRALVAQVVALHPPGCADLLLLTEPGSLPDWEWARWLPHLPAGAVLCGPAAPRSLAARLAAHRAAADGSWLVVLVDQRPDPRLAELLTAAGDPRVLVLATATTAAQLAVPRAALLRCAGEVGEAGLLGRAGGGEGEAVRTDRLQPDLAVQLARDLAGLTAAGSASALPPQVRLAELPGPGLRPVAGDALSGSWSRRRDALVAVLGCSATGPLVVDLCRSGPHALVAGTTGAGKSELLQTLVCGLALAHPPDRCSFLLVDYKGGAAFGQAAALPHTVGLLTDLDRTTTARALRSLAAELTRRERLLAEHRVADVAELPDGVDPARLVIVVDEFATLAEELPSFVPGLVGIAQRGRSLGVHLVLATQRPAGVVSAEIRANCTLRICLRTTDEADSRDVLGSPDAALLPVDLPGRGYLRSGSGAPTCFQTARVSGPPPDPDAAAVVRRWSWPAGAGPGAPDPAPSAAAGRATDLARLVAALDVRAAEDAAPPPHRPWLPPLPAELPALPPHAGRGRRVPLGLVDRPDRQAQPVLELDLDEGGCWLAVGGPRSGRTTLLRAVLAGAVAAAGPDELHVHVLDQGGGALAGAAAGLPHAGTCIGDGDPLRTTRLVDRLAEEVAARRAAPSPGTAPRLLLLVDGVEPLTALLDECDPARGSAALLRLVRDGAAVGLTCVLTADRAVPGGRLAALATSRLVLPLADGADYAVAGVRAADVPVHRPPGRALLGEAAWECQLALPTTRPPQGAGTGSLAPAPPLRVVELPADPELDRIDVAGGPPASGLPLPVGPGGDDGGVLAVDLVRTGGLLVLGPPGSGRSTALAAFATDLAGRGLPVVRLAAGPSVPAGSSDPGETDDPLAPADPLHPDDVAGLTGWLAGLPAGEPAVLVADDVTGVGWTALAGAVTGAAGRPVVVLAAGSAADLAGCYQGPVAALRRSRTGLLLRPGPVEADVLGVRLPRTPVPARPGSGWLVRDGLLTRVQVARHRAVRPPTAARADVPARVPARTAAQAPAPAPAPAPAGR
jgi:DNA segregation ATPase FtsK/SpoIIIE, S-DNA-T family